MIKVAEGFQASQQMGQKFDAEFYRIDDGVDERFFYQISKALILNQRTRLLRFLNHSSYALSKILSHKLIPAAVSDAGRRDQRSSGTGITGDCGEKSVWTMLASNLLCKHKKHIKRAENGSSSRVISQLKVWAHWCSDVVETP